MSSIIKKELVDLSIIELIAVLKKETPKNVELKFDIGTPTVSLCKPFLRKAHENFRSYRVT